MSWSFKIGRFFGIDVYLHVTFLLLLLGIVGYQYLQTQNWVFAIREMLFIAMIFFIVVLHEYGHALTARQFGVKTHDITLLPIGGVARLERIPEKPVEEFLIAIAGPAVNVVLALLCLAWLFLSGDGLPGLRSQLMSGGLVERLFLVNVSLVVFNMLPAFPMDGGRVLRSLLAMNMDYVRATQVAAWVGQMFALVFGVVGLMYFSAMPMLLLIALFIWVGASQESAMVAQRSVLAGVRVGQAMMSDFRTVDPRDTLETVALHVLAGFQQDFPVMREGQVVGVITRRDLLSAMARVGREVVVEEVMQREFVTARPDELLTDVFPRLQGCECNSMPVVADGKLLGLLSAENIGELIMFRNASSRRRTAV